MKYLILIALLFSCLRNPIRTSNQSKEGTFTKETNAGGVSTGDNGSGDSSEEDSEGQDSAGNDSGGESTSGEDDGGDDGDDDHDDGEPMGPPKTSAAFVFEVADNNIELALNEEVIIPVTIKALKDFKGEEITLTIDGNPKYSITKTDIEKVNIKANEEAKILLTIKINSMSESYQNREFVLVGNNGNEVMGNKMKFNLTVKPEITIGIINDAIPHEYNIKDKDICVSEHADGVQVIFKNMTMNFGANGNGPCIHTVRPLKHCNTANRMQPGDTYLPPKVLPDAGERAAIFYNHYASNDNIGRRIHFNVPADSEIQKNCVQTTDE